MAYKLNPYLNFDGNCEEAMNFYKNAFGVEFEGGRLCVSATCRRENMKFLMKLKTG